MNQSISATRLANISRTNSPALGRSAVKKSSTYRMTGILSTRLAMAQSNSPGRGIVGMGRLWEDRGATSQTNAIPVVYAAYRSERTSAVSVQQHAVFRLKGHIGGVSMVRPQRDAPAQHTEGGMTIPGASLIRARRPKGAVNISFDY